MDWMNRGNRPAQTNVNGAAAPQSVPVERASGKDKGKGMRIASVGVIFLAAVLLLAIIAAFVVGGGKGVTSQSKYVDSKQMQAVFLNGGQVYFGNIKTINNQYLSIENIYYLRVNQQVQPNGTTTSGQDISLVKLGCELHGPEDKMVVNQSQVIFWENLKADGQVAKAVEKYKADNPNGQKCDTNTSNSSSTTDQNAQTNTNTTNTTNTTNNSTSTTKKQ